MNRSLVLHVALVTFCLASAAQTARAAIVASGDVDPADPSTWTSSTDGYIGKTAGGTLTVDSGSDLDAYRGYIGYNSGVTGLVTVTGTGSTWDNSSELYIGYNGSGTLNITAGGTVSGGTYCYIGPNSDSTGIVTIGGAGSTLNGGGLILGNGTLNITGSGSVSSHGWNFVGMGGSNSTAVMTVDGIGSTWNNYGLLHVGHLGNGTLNISGGATVTVNYETYLSAPPTSTGTPPPYTGIINFSNGTLTTQMLYASPTQLTGAGTINAHGLVSDLDLVFDATHGSSQTITLDSQPGQNVALNLDMSNPSDNGVLGAGWKGAGSLTISDGITVNSRNGQIGYLSTSTGVVTVSGTGSTWNSGGLIVGFYGNGTLNITGGGAVNSSGCYIGVYPSAMGVVTVDGTGSTWNNGGYLYVGHGGNGTLNIIGGGAVSSSLGYIGDWPISTGVVTVDGTGSMWNNSSSLEIGHNGSGTLNITGGGAVTAGSVSINSQSLLAIDVGNGSSLNVSSGGGTIDNDGVVRIIAGAKPAAYATFTPISAGTWSGSGTYQAIGGEWNATSHVFTASAVQSGTSGMPVEIDLANIQRMLIDDSGTGWSVGASFLAKSGSLSLTATAISGGTLTALENLLYPGGSVLGGWQFAATGGYAPGDPAYLSFDIGDGYSRDYLEVWHYDGANWTEYAAADLTYNGTYASFTVTSFSGYAVTAVPEPGALALLAAALVGLPALVRRKQK